MRLFIAFDVSKEAKDELIGAQKKLKYAKLNLVREFHLTLKFLGEVDEENVEEIKQKLKKVKFNSFEAELGSTGTFPSEDYIKVVWVGLEPKKSINELQQSIENALESMFPKDTRFHPHITLARVKFVEDKEQFKGNLKGIETKKIGFSVDSFKLIKSELRPGGPVYEVLEEFKAG